MALVQWGRCKEVSQHKKIKHAKLRKVHPKLKEKYIKNLAVPMPSIKIWIKFCLQPQSHTILQNVPHFINKACVVQVRVRVRVRVRVLVLVHRSNHPRTPCLARLLAACSYHYSRSDSLCPANVSLCLALLRQIEPRNTASFSRAYAPSLWSPMLELLTIYEALHKYIDVYM